MKTSNLVRLALALMFAFENSLLVTHAGFGVAGAWILGTIISTGCFAFLGGNRRIVFVAISVVPPFAILTADNFSFYRQSFTSWNAFLEIAPMAAVTLVLLVALPILIVHLAGRVQK